MVEIQFPLADRLSNYLSRELETAVGTGVFREFGVSVKILPYLFNLDLLQEDISRVYRLAINPSQGNVVMGEYHINISQIDINRNALTRSYLGFFPMSALQQLPSGLLIPKTGTPHVSVTGNIREGFTRDALELYSAEFTRHARSGLSHLPRESLEYLWQVDFLDKNIFREFFEREKRWWEENVGPFELLRDTGYREYHTQYLEEPVEEISPMQLLLPSGHEDTENNLSYHQFLATCFEDLLKGVRVDGTVLIATRMDIPFP